MVDFDEYRRPSGPMWVETELRRMSGKPHRDAAQLSGYKQEWATTSERKGSRRENESEILGFPGHVVVSPFQLETEKSLFEGALAPRNELYNELQESLVRLCMEVTSLIGLWVKGEWTVATTISVRGQQQKRVAVIIRGSKVKQIAEGPAAVTHRLKLLSQFCPNRLKVAIFYPPKGLCTQRNISAAAHLGNQVHWVLTD